MQHSREREPDSLIAPTLEFPLGNLRKVPSLSTTCIKSQEQHNVFARDTKRSTSPPNATLHKTDTSIPIQVLLPHPAKEPFTATPTRGIPGKMEENTVDGKEGTLNPGQRAVCLAVV